MSKSLVERVLTDQSSQVLAASLKNQEVMLSEEQYNRLFEKAVGMIEDKTIRVSGFLNKDNDGSMILEQLALREDYLPTLRQEQCVQALEAISKVRNLWAKMENVWSNTRLMREYKGAEMKQKSKRAAL